MTYNPFSTNFLFWNLGKQQGREDLVASLVQKHNIHILLLAEWEGDNHKLINALKDFTEKEYCFSDDHIPGKIKIISLYSGERLSPAFSGNLGRLAMYRIKPNNTEILLAVVHLPSKQNLSDTAQALNATECVSRISQEEEESGNNRTVLVGDFNMNPFDPGMISAHCFHSVMCRKIAQKESRLVQGKSYSYFFNPMWSLFGDGTKGPSGTFLSRRS